MTEELILLRQRLIDTLADIDKVLAKCNIPQVSIMKPNNPNPITAERVIYEVCDYYSIKREDLSDVKRTGDYVPRRIITAALMDRLVPNIKQREIAALLGYTSSRTVRHHLDNFAEVLNGTAYGFNDRKHDYAEIKKRIEREVISEVI